MKKWTEVAADPRFAELSEEERLEARQEYFNDLVVEHKIPTEHQAQAWGEFDLDTRDSIALTELPEEVPQVQPESVRAPAMATMGADLPEPEVEQPLGVMGAPEPSPDTLNVSRLGGALKKELIENVPERIGMITGGMAQEVGTPSVHKLAGQLDEIDVEDDSFFGKLKRAGQVISMTPTVLSALAETTGGSTLMKVKKGIADWGRDLFKTSQEEVARNQPEGLNSLEKVIVDSARGLQDMGPAIAAGIATRNPVFPVGIITGQVYGQTYGDSRDKGLTPEQATARAKFHSLAEGLPEMIPFSAILKKGSPILRKYFDGMIGEGAQEMITEVLQGTYDRKELEGMSLKSALTNIDWNDVAYAGLIGSIVGTGMAGSVHAYDTAEAKYRASKLAKTNKGIKSRLDSINTMMDEIAEAEQAGATENEMEARAQEVEEEESILKTEVAAVWDDYEADQKTTKAIEEEMGFAAIEEDAAPVTTEGAIEVAAEGRALEREVTKAPPTAMELALKEAKPKQQAIETAVAEVDTTPTEAQKEAGNYKKAHVSVQGLDISIENPKGSVRSGVDEGGQKWSQEIKSHYGYIKKTNGADGDQVDVFLGENPEQAEIAYVVDQVNPETGKFDEHKLMIGYPNIEAAEDAYLENYEKGWQGLGNVTAISMPDLKEWLKGDTTKPVDLEQPKLSRRAVSPIKRTEEYDNALTQMAGELTVGGGIDYIGRETGAITGRTKSVNPSWAQSLMSDTGVTVKQIQNAVEKYKAGQPLGVRQQQIIEGMIAQHEGDKEAGGGVAVDIEPITPPKDDFEIPFMSKKAKPEKPKAKKHVRRKLAKTKDGRYIGVPIWVEKASDVTKLRSLLRKLAKEGEVGRMWYENSSKMIMRLTGNNKVDAEIVAQLIAIYSPQNSIFPNMTQAVQAYYQFKSGVKKEDFVVRPMGQKKDGVLVNTLDHKAIDLLYNKKPWEGRKTNTFYENLMIDIEHSGVHAVTVDMWMARAFGYLNDGIASGVKEGSGVYSFIENEVTDIANEYGWTPHQAQAAIWVAIKGRHEIPAVKEATIKESVKKGFSEYGANGKWKAPSATKKAQEHRKIWRKHALKADLTAAHLESSKYDFHDALKDMYGKVSWEARPSTDTNVLKGIQNAPLEQHIEYQTAISEALTDKDGNDIVAKKIGMLTDNELIGAGVWDGFVGAGAQRNVVMPQKRKKATKEAAVSPPTAKILNLYSDIKGYILSQDGVSWHRPFYTTTVKDSNGMDFQLGRPITYEEAAAVAEIVDKTIDKDVVPIPTETGVRFLNFTIVDNKVFHAKIVEAMDSIFESSDIAVSHRRFGSDGFLQTNDWTENTNGQEYRQRILESGGRDTLNWVDSELAQRVERVNKQFEKRYGWKTTKPAAEKIGSLTSPIPLHRLENAVAAQREIYGRFGKFENKDTTENLKFYNLDKIVEDPSLVDDLLAKFGYNVKYFSFDPENWKLPKLKKDGYQQGTLWIYDPAVAHGSFKDTEYTRQWRIVHELGHGLTERIMQDRYGDSRREGRMGRTWDAQRGDPKKKVVTVQLEPLTLMHAQRAVEWEDVAFRVQRMLFNELGIKASPETFGKEYNNNVADAIHRSLTGDFADAGITGFVPHGTLPQVKSILQLLENQEKSMAKEQGRKPTKGIDLKTYKRFSEAELQSLIDEQVTLDPALSRKATGDVRMGKEELQVFVDGISRDWKNAPPITAVGSVRELPLHLYNFVKSENAEGEVDGIFDTATGQVFLVASGIADANHAIRVVFHEVMGHAGIRGMLGTEIKPFLKQLFAAKRNEMNEVAEMYNLDFTKENDRLTAAEEWLAMEAENAPRSTWVQRFISFVRQILRKIFPNFKVTNGEVLGALGRMRQVIKEGDRTQDSIIRSHPLLAKAKPVFYSQMERVLSAKLPNKGTGQSFTNAINAYVKKGQIKAEEVEWSDVLNFLRLTEAITKQEVLDYIAENKIDVQEEVRGEPEGGVQLDFNEYGADDYNGGWFGDEEVLSFREDTEVGYKIIETPTGFFVEDETGDVVNNIDVTTATMYGEYNSLDDAINAANKHLDENNAVVVGDGPRHKQYTLEGGKDYRELILTLPDQIEPYKPDSIHFTEEGGGTAVAWIRFNTRKDADGNKVMFIEEIQSKRHMDAKKKGYKGDVKFTYSYDGVEHEFSTADAAQQHMKDRIESGDISTRAVPMIKKSTGVPDAPFKKNWRLLAIKRAIRYASENGFDSIAWTTGEQQAERYDLSKEISRVLYVPNDKVLTAFNLQDEPVVHEKGVEPEQVADYIGKEAADKLFLEENTNYKHLTKDGGVNFHEIEGVDLKVGGEGLKTLYDKIIPKEIGKYVKKWGAKVSSTKLETHDRLRYPTIGEWAAAGYEGNPWGTVSDIADSQIDVMLNDVKVAEFDNREEASAYMDAETAKMMATTQQSIDITQEMRDSVMQGQPMFSRNRGERETAALTEEVKTSIWDAYKTKAKAAIGKLDNMIDGFGHLEDIVQYREARGIAQANIHKSQEVAKRIYNVFKDLSATEARSVFEYMTDRDASEGLVSDPRVRAEAMRAKNMINTIGKLLVDRGVIPAASQQHYSDRYLPRLYLAYLMGDKAISALGGGKKLSKQGYAMHRDEKLSKEYREVVLGEIKDPAFLASRAIGVPARDLVIMDFFDDILENPAWSLPDQTIKFKVAGASKARNVTAFWLQREAARMREMADIMKDGEQKQKTLRIADQYDSQSRKFLPKEYDHNEWKQLPDTPQYGVLRGLIVKKAIYDDLLGVAHAVPENDLNAWQRLFNYGSTGTKITQAWKTTKVALNPPSQIRNLVSNWVLLNLSGVRLDQMPIYLAKAAREIATGGKYYKIAEKYGVTAGTFTAHELLAVEREFLDFKARNTSKFSITGLMHMASGITNKAGDLYQLAEVLSKVAKIAYEVEKNNMEPALAAQEANKWLFDYSAVNPTIRTVRNAPVGAPFLTFYMKVLPRLLETAATAPWRFLPYYILLRGLTMAVAALNDVDEEDVEKLKKALPEWLRDADQTIIIPWKDSEGRWQVFDAGYFFPWTAWTGAGKSVAGFFDPNETDAGKNTLQSLGLFSGPVPSLIAAMSTNVDPFTRKEIVKDGDLPAQKVYSVFNYLNNMAMPPWMTEKGPLAKMWKAGTGFEDRWGNPQPSLPQATMRWMGVNIMPIEAERTRKTSLKFMARDMQDVKSSMRRELSNPNLSTEQKRVLRKEYKDELRRMQERFKQYKVESEVHPNLRN